MEIVLVVSRADGQPSPHDGRWITAWNPHTKFGICEITTTNMREHAKVFANGQAIKEWKTISKIQPKRPDGEPNRPLCGLTVEVERI